MGKHIIVVHGYLLSGTGSNIYSCNLAMQWKKQGHAITVFCQDPQAGTYEWVDEFFTSEASWPKDPPAPGKVRVLVPDIAGLLPVYVYDEYEGYTVKTIPNCTDEEIERHISMTSKAIRKAVDMWGCDKVLTNHALLSPVNAKRALEGTGIPFDIKIHGSALIFVVDPHPQYKKYAIEAIKKCNRIIAGTRHTVSQVMGSFAQEKDDLDLEKKLVIVPPGMDPTVFSLCKSIDSNITAFLEVIGKHIAKEGNGRRAADIQFPKISNSSENIHQKLVDLGKSYNQRVVDADLPTRLPKFAADEPVITYFGKFLNTKGVGEILLSFPAIVKAVPKARLLLIGFGTFREHLEAMIHGLTTGDITLFKAAAHSKDENGKTFLDSNIDIDKYFRKLEPSEASRIIVTGCLNHSELGLILPLASIGVVASKASEAFGMVAVEAMSAGVLPLCVYHSGLIDVLDQTKEKEPELEALMHLEVESGGDFGVAAGASFMEAFKPKVMKALAHLYPATDEGKKKLSVSEKIRAVAEAIWSWDGICQRLVEL
ncbi:uncharacterized protein LOC106181476 [Lingula anatina]|uniref:Uncharacterized protein LOC106181476 n=1 Tax=Lingula anatina TaxID=7574 RepID=A0A1S3KFP6_LINAN|nr:uncharacterized protein LOC106181476 [Lingula anatina]|eukprot:XP_013421312.1 uncharacterized protein LOC106181476 [Lingula anatina]